MAFYEDQLLVNGKPVPGVQAVLYDKSNNVVDVDITKRTGKFSFPSIGAGIYTIKFIGMNLGSETYKTITIIEEDPLVFNSEPTFNVIESEGKAHVDVNGNELTYAEFNWTNLEEKTGMLKSILVYYKRSNEGSIQDYIQFADVVVPSSKSTWEDLTVFGKGTGGSPYRPLATSSICDMSTGLLKTRPAGWIPTRPTPTVTPAYACDYTFVGKNEVTGVDWWSDVYVDSCTTGTTSIKVFLYYSGTVSLMPGGTQYNRSTGTISVISGGNLNGWSQTKPAISTTPVYRTSCVFNFKGTAITSEVTNNWVLPTIYSKLGIDGENTTNTITIYRGPTTEVNTFIIVWDPESTLFKNVWEVDQLKGYNILFSDNTKLQIVGNTKSSIDSITGLLTTVLTVNDDTSAYAVGEIVTLTNDSRNTTFKKSIFLYSKPCKYDFYCVYLDTSSVASKMDGKTLVSSIYEFPFDGVPDFEQLIEVKDLKIGNLKYLQAEDTDNVGFSSAKSLPGVYADLRWKELKEIPRELWVNTGFRNAVGDSVEVSYEQAQRIKDYVVYMFVSKSKQPPTYKRPGLKKMGPTYPDFGGPDEVELNGATDKWYLMGYYPTGTARVRCNFGDTVSFWVGFRMRADILPLNDTVENAPTLFY